MRGVPSVVAVTLVLAACALAAPCADAARPGPQPGVVAELPLTTADYARLHDSGVKVVRLFMFTGDYNDGGFRERKQLPGPALHVVMVERAKNRWAAHFDLYDPLLSVLDLWRHIYLEGWRQKLPSWRQIGGPFKE